MHYTDVLLLLQSLMVHCFEHLGLL